MCVGYGPSRFAPDSPNFPLTLVCSAVNFTRLRIRILSAGRRRFDAVFKVNISLRTSLPIAGALQPPLCQEPARDAFRNDQRLAVCSRAPRR